MVPIADIPDALLQGFRRLNARLVPPERYQGSIALGLSALEEIYLVSKNVVDASVHVSESILYEDDYHERRVAQYSGQRRALVFVPGYMQAPIGFVRLERFLGLEMFDTFTYRWGGFPYSQDITLSARQLEEVLRDLCERTGVSEVFLLGHSQGGIIIRALVQHGLGRGLPITRCLFLSSPHQGTWVGLLGIPHRSATSIAGLVPFLGRVQGESALQLLPGSLFLKTLNRMPLPDGIRFFSVYYALDPIIWPTTNAILPYPEAMNFFVPKIGHAQSLYCTRAARIALQCLYGENVRPEGPA